MSDVVHKPTHWTVWLGVAGSIFAAGGTWYVTSERQEKQAVTVADHEGRLRNVEGNRRLEDMVIELSKVITGQSVKIDQLEERVREQNAEINALRKKLRW